MFSTPKDTYLLTGLQELINGHYPVLIPVHFLQPKPHPRSVCVSPGTVPVPGLRTCRGWASSTPTYPLHWTLSPSLLTTDLFPVYPPAPEASDSLLGLPFPEFTLIGK